MSRKRFITIPLLLGLLLIAMLATAGGAGATPVATCTTICYVDDTGSDANDGSTIATAFATIQKGLDTVSPGGVVRVLPGAYDETATGRDVLGVSSYQFGLYFNDGNNDGVTLMGVTAGDVPITDPAATAAVITTNATNNFGSSGIFVEADDVTIAGLEIGDNFVANVVSNNKTIEVIGNGFTLEHSKFSVTDGGYLYIGDWRYDDGTDTSYITSYAIDDNIFGDGGGIAIASGAGVTGPVSGRTITNNEFEFSEALYTTWSGSWANIVFRGAGGYAWYTYPVGGAVVTGNTFTNDAPDGVHIEATGDYEEPDFDWASIWNDNTYNKAVVVGSAPPATLTAWSDTFADPGGYCPGADPLPCVFPNIRQIGATIQTEIDHGVDGDTVLVNEGTYPESPTVDKSLVVMGEDGRDVTFIELQTNTNYTHSLLISGAEVTVDGFTIVGIDAACPTLAATNIYVNTAPDNVYIQNNRFQVGAVGGCSTGDDGYGLITEYSGNPDVASLTVADNIFEPLNTAGQRAFYINPSVVEFTFRDNDITGQFDAGSFSEAQDNLIEDNTITGTGASGGIGLWGYLDPGVWGKGTIQGNTISGTANAISLYEAEQVTVTHNILDGNGRGVRVGEILDTAFDQTTIHINRNSLAGNTTAGIANLLDQVNYGDVDGECNWWGAADGPGPVGSGSGSPVTADVDFTDWLGSADLDGPCPAPPVVMIYVSPNMKNGVVDGVPFDDQDILVNELGTSDWEMFFDGSTQGITKNLTDFTFDAADCLLMTFNGNQKIGATLYKPQDVAQFCPTNPGDYSAGTFSMYLDGSDVGLTAGGEIIDALEVLADGRLVISTKGNAKVPENASASILAQKNDLLVFNYTAYGPVTTGYWSMYLDNILVPGLNKENIISSYIDNGDKYMTFWANFTVGDETGDYNDIVVIHPDYSADVFWDADDYGYHGRIHGLHIK